MYFGKTTVIDFKKKEDFYKLARETADELLLPGKDGKAVKWREKQEASVYLYWNRRTGKFRIGRIKYGEIGKGYVNAEHKYDGMSKNEIRVGLLHTHFWSIYSSFHDIAGVRKLVEQEIGNEHLKAFRAILHQAVQFSLIGKLEKSNVLREKG